MSVKKGIIVAAGLATRLHPATQAFGKQILPIYDKPMIFYPLATLFLAGVRDILLITTGKDLPLFQSFLGDGKQYGVSISYLVQTEARGIADAFLIGRDFINGDKTCLILGDNFFHGPGLDKIVSKAARSVEGATIFCHAVSNPRAYGVAVLDARGNVTELAEKPAEPRSDWAVTGLYFYDSSACDRAKALKPSARGELEITDLNISYLNQGKLRAEILGAAFAWRDLGTHDSMLDTACLVREEERRSGVKIGCPDEAAYRMGFIDREQLLRNADGIKNTDYATYLRKVAGS
jgi:glucose-1-phosphate thymidylyltransferase